MFVSMVIIVDNRSLMFALGATKMFGDLLYENAQEFGGQLFLYMIDIATLVRTLCKTIECLKRNIIRFFFTFCVFPADLWTFFLLVDFFARLVFNKKRYGPVSPDPSLGYPSRQLISFIR